MPHVHGVMRWLFAFAVLVCSCPASAQPPAPLHVQIARICISEVGWDGRTECSAIVASLRNRAARTDRTLRVHARLYSSAVFDRTRTDDRRWIVFLRADGMRPRGWPRHMRWSYHQDRWFRMMDHVRDLLAAPRIDHGCNVEPEDWAARTDTMESSYRGAYPRAMIVDCGDTKNRFWRPEPVSIRVDT